MGWVWSEFDSRHSDQLHIDMEKFRPNQEIPRDLSAEASAKAGESTPESDMVYHALNRKYE